MRPSTYETFDAAEARRIVKRLEFHHTPKHASWLNPVLSLPKGMAEIEFSVLTRAESAGVSGTMATETAGDLQAANAYWAPQITGIQLPLFQKLASLSYPGHATPLCFRLQTIPSSPQFYLIPM